ncbi:hypothetical protein DY000_02055698 [Brassica cretica]|uniref:Uncharacterized protein n=1 Tax=Brassica cretica TaxID=69181 RepID=A0ABQ7AH85_BRACR|nr:hypothetical protein DY000_02055698 [Brassica cretica]
MVFSLILSAAKSSFGGSPPLRCMSLFDGAGEDSRLLLLCFDLDVACSMKFFSFWILSALVGVGFEVLTGLCLPPISVCML